MKLSEIIDFPDNLTVGGSLNLKDTGITPIESNAGNSNRDIYLWHHKEKGWVVSLWCFTGNLSETIEAIRKKYGRGSSYEEKIINAFNKAKSA